MNTIIADQDQNLREAAAFKSYRKKRLGERQNKNTVRKVQSLRSQKEKE